MRFETITASTEATALEVQVSRSGWNTKLPAHPTPMQQFIWSEACFATMYRSSEAIVLITPGGVAPFVRKGLIPTIQLAGAEELAEPIEPAYADRAAAEQLADLILARKLPVRLGQPLADTPFAEAFLRKARQSGLLVTRPTEGSPFIELDASWSNALDRFSSRRRSDFRRMRRRAEEHGALAFEFHEPSADDAPALVELAIEIEAKGWKARSGTAISDNPDQLAFFRYYAKLAAAEGIFRIAFLKIGSEKVAAQIAVEFNGSFWLFKIGYDERFARCSPGQLLMLESIERAARKGLSRIEFLGKAAEWTQFWTRDERPRMKLLYYPWNAFGAAALVRDAISLAKNKMIALLGR